MGYFDVYRGVRMLVLGAVSCAPDCATGAERSALGSGGCDTKDAMV